MAGQPRRAQAGLTLVFLAILIATLFGPISARADTDLVIGGQARIAYANGDDVRLRESPAFNGTLIRYIPEGSVVDVLDGPAEGDEGSLWFEVAFDGDTGYVVSDYLALLRGEDEVAANSVVAADAGDVVGSALIANTSDDGVRCRTEPSSGGAVITVVPEGTWVELTGASAGGWQPINCGGQGGFVSDRYVSYDGTGTDNVGDGDGDSSVGAMTAEASGSSAVTGAATVSGTNGDGVNCRSSASTGGNVITILSEGSSVSLRGDPRGDWQPVVCAGSNGFVSSQFLDVGDGGGDDGGSGDAGGDDATGEAVVDGTNGDGVNCRTRASSSGSVIVVLPEGADVTLRGGASGGWQPVFCGGSQGFVSSQYLATGGGGGGDDGGDGGSGEVTGEATVTGTGNGLRCRTRGTFDSSVITVLFDGDGVSLRGNVSGDWQPVVCAGRNGFVFADYLDYDGNGGGDDGGSDDGSGPFAVGATVVVDGTNGDGVRLRSSASGNGSIVMVVAEGQTATVISGSTSSWVAVTYKSTSGFISATYLAASSGGDGGDDDGDDDGGGSDGLSVGDNARTTADLNLRYDPRMSAGVAAVAPSGTVVRITGGASSGFYAVDWDGLSGYMSGDYLRYTDEDPTERGGSGDEDIVVDEPDDNGGGGGGSSSGSAIVDYAMQYVGYPYVWATRGPSSFDCSGFTYWVVLNTLGINISPGTAAQINYGTPISRGSIQPGDLIFFQNTYTWGLSHVGIYIGGGKFVHAENESTGVVVSDLGSSYYSSRWYGARRVG